MMDASDFWRIRTQDPKHDPRDTKGRYRPKYRLAELLEAKGWGAQARLADYLGVHSGVISDWRSGKRYMSNEHIIRAAFALHTNALFILGLVDDETPDLRMTEARDVADAFIRRSGFFNELQGAVWLLEEKYGSGSIPLEELEPIYIGFGGDSSDLRDLSTLAGEALRIRLAEGEGPGRADPLKELLKRQPLAGDELLTLFMG